MKQSAQQPTDVETRISVSEPALPLAFGIEVHLDRDVARLAAAGELDMATIHVLEAHLEGLRETGYRSIVVDLRELRFMDSTGLRLLIDWDVRAREEDFEISLIQGGPDIRRLFEICGLLEQLPFVESPAPTSDDPEKLTLVASHASTLIFEVDA